MSCIFFKIISGEIPANKLYEDDDFIVILDAYPSSAGHSLVIPKIHVEDVFEMDAALAGRAFALAAKIAKKARQGLECDGVNILQNNRKAAGQTVHHFHVHVIPRYVGDNVIIRWAPATPTDGEIEKICKKLAYL